MQARIVRGASAEELVCTLLSIELSFITPISLFFPLRLQGANSNFTTKVF